MPTATINAGVVFAAFLVLPLGDDSIHVGNAQLFLLLVTLYDRYRP